MLKHILCHVPGIGPKTERDLWQKGITSWEDILGGAHLGYKRCNRQFVKRSIEESVVQLEHHNPSYFYRGLPSPERWRIFADFRDCTALLDIETNGLAGPLSHITTIAVMTAMKCATTCRVKTSRILKTTSSGIR